MATDKRTQALEFAELAHGEQKYGGEFAYSVHLIATENVLLRFGVTDEFHRVCALLHDVLEDTPTTYESVMTFFGREVANVVARLTEPKGGNRAWRHEQAYPRIRENQSARLVKLADRIANCEARGKLLGMYRKEYADFKDALYVASYTTAEERLHDIEEQLWSYLDSLIIMAPKEVVTP